MKIIVGWSAVLVVLGAIVYAILEADIARELYQGPLPKKALKRFIEKRMLTPICIVIFCLILIWIAFV